MLSALLLSLLACGDGDTGTSVDSGPSDDTGVTDTDDTGPTDAPDAETDVLVIGSGPAGLAAAWEARDAGARVIVLEREAVAGGAGWFAANFFAVATSWQGLLGIDDSVEKAEADWPLFTGGDGTDPWVNRLLTDSGTTLAWLVYEFGLEVFDVYLDPSAGSLPRVHVVAHPDQGPSIAPLVASLVDEVWLNAEATSLRIVDGRVAGAVATDLLTGESFTVAAGAVVVATGGFARDLERVQADRPDLAGLNIVFEAAHTSDGGGQPLLDGVAAASQNAGNFGVYLHSAADQREDYEGEAIWIPSMSQSLVLSTEGRRVINEDETRSFHLSHRLVDMPDGRLYAVYPADVISSASAMIPAYNWVELGVPEEINVDGMVNEGLAVRYDSPTELAQGQGMDVDTVLATFDAYEAAVSSKADTEFRKTPGDLISFGGETLTLFELVPGAAKAFGGAALDPSAQVLDLDGAPVPGLYAGGEVAGMLGAAAVGEGFSGSITACYLTGRLAGQSAAAAALAR